MNMKKSQKQLTIVTSILFILYLLVLTWIILFKFSLSFKELPHLRGINIIPFGASVITNGTLDFTEIVQNMLAFIPFGLYLSMLKPNWPFVKKILLIAGTSLLYEILQFICSIGATDITDLISNSTGGVVGILLYFAFSKLLMEKTHKILNILASIGTICIILFLGIIILTNL